MDPLVSILITNYNTSTYLKSSLSILLEKFNPEDPLFEVIVVDNNSKDEIDEVIKLFTQVKFIKNKTNKGFAFAQNQAFKISTGKYILTFNPDAEIDSENIKNAVSYLEKNQDAGLLAACSLNEDNSLSVPQHTFPVFSDSVLKRMLFKSENKNISSPIEVNWIWGTGLFVRKELFQNQLFQEDSFLFWEEYELAKKIKQAQKKIIIHPKVLMQHYASVSFKYNPIRLSTARKLSSAHGYLCRKKEFGLFLTKLNMLKMFFENSLMWGLIKIKSLFAQKNISRELMLANYKAESFAAFNLIFFGVDYVTKMETKARTTFL